MVKRLLFDNDREDVNHIYRALRNPENCGAERARKSCEDMWPDFSEHADPNFLDEFPTQFNQRWFEMYLTVSFIRNGFNVESKDSGPDIRIVVDGKPVWIEAACPTSGQADKEDSVPELIPGVAQTVPFREYALRIRSVLEDKQRKYRKYLKEGIVSENDITIVAISACGIPFLQFNMEEAIARAVYGLGDKYFYIDDITKQYAGSGRVRKPKIPKSSGSPVDVTPFLDSSMEHISAVISSSANTTTDLREIGRDCVLFRNPTAASPWRGDCFPWMRVFPIGAIEGADIVQSL